MKLHLPKALLTAVMALFAVSQTAWAGWSADNNTGNHAYYYDQDNGNNGTIDTLTLPTADNGVEIENSNLFTADDRYVKLYICSGYDTDNNGSTIPEGYDGQTSTINKLEAADGQQINIAINPWQDWKFYKLLTIGNLEIGGGSGAGSLTVSHAKDNVLIKNISGTISNLSVGGNLTIGKADDTSSTYTLQTVDVTSGGKLILNGGVTTMGNGAQSVKAAGEIVVNTGAKLKFAATDITHWSEKTNISILGGEWDTNGTRQNFAGGSVIKLSNGLITDANGTFGDGYGAVDITSGSIESSGTSSIAGGVRLRNANTDITVSDGTLTIDRIVNHWTMTGGITKKGAGTLIIQSTDKGKAYSNNNAQIEYFDGNTVLEAGTVEYAADSDTSYAGTISGTGNIAKSGTGTVTLANISGLDGDISVSGGTLNVTALTTNKTIDVSVAGGTLNIGSITVNATTHQLSVKEGSSGTSYYTTDGTESGKNDLQNGFILTSGDFVLFNDYVWSGTVEGWSVSDDGTNTYLTSAGTVSTEYYITSGEVSVGASTGAENYIVQGGTMNLTDGSVDVEYTSGSIVLATAAAIKLTSADNLTNIVSNTTGTGTISVADSATLNQGTYAFAGTLDVAAGKQLNYGNAQGQAVAAADATVRLGDNSVLYVESHSSTLGVLDVQGNATLRAYDSSDATNPALTIGEVKIAADKTLGTATNWEGMMVINKLNAEGTLNSAFNGSSPLVINAIEKSGAINNADAGATMTLGADGSSVLNLGGNVTNAGTLNIKGQLAGTSTISGGTINLADTASVAGTITLASDVAISGTLGNTGSLILNGNVTIADVTSLKSVGAITYSDNSGQDGYLTSAQYYVFESTDGGTATVAEGMKLNNTYDLTVGNNSVIISIDEANPSGTYYVNNTVNYGGDGSSTQIMADTTTGITMNGGTLNLNTALAEGVAISTVKSGSTISLAAGVTLDNSAVTPGDVKSTLTGVAATDSTEASVYNMGVAKMNGEGNSANNETKLNVAIGEGWQGTVVFEEGSSFKDYSFDLNDYGVAGSTIQFNGTATGSYLGQGTNSKATYVADIELKGDGFSIENGFGGRTYTFTGAFKGDGTFNMNKAGLNGGLGFIFSGNMSKWTGELKQSDAANDSYSYTFNEKATNIANKVTAAAGTMVVNVDNSADVTMTGDVTATGGTMKLTKTGASKLTVNNIAANGGNVVLAGKGDDAIEVGNMSIKAGNTVTGDADVSVTTTLAVAAENALVLTGALTMGNNATVDLTGLIINEDQTSYTLATATGGVTGSISMENITGLDLTGTAYEGWSYSIAAQANPQTRSASETALVLTLTKDDDTTPLTTLNVTGVDVQSSSAGALTLTTAENATDAVFGNALNAVMDDATWADIKAALKGDNITLDDSIAVTFVGADGVTFDFDGENNTDTAPVVTINGEVTRDADLNAVGQTLTNNGTTVGNYVTAYIPEPTTGTLSILALAGLMIRRRRR